MGVLSWLIFGLIAGALGKYFMSTGKEPRGWAVTIVLGIVGAMVGGFVGSAIVLGKVTGFNLGSFFLAVLGTMIVLAGYQALSKK